MAETILIVDADPVQRRPIENTVRRFGYAPLVAAGGAAALELATDAPRVDGIIRLQIGRSTLYRRLKDLGLEPDETRDVPRSGVAQE